MAALRNRPLTITPALFQEHNEFNSSMARSQTNTARIDGLRPGMVYVVQVRARTVAGYGKFSGKMCFQTLTDGKGWASDLAQGEQLREEKKLHSQPRGQPLPALQGNSLGRICLPMRCIGRCLSEIQPISVQHLMTCL